jgi:3-phosphoshikimate 1-carboxyvinyltransferase
MRIEPKWSTDAAVIETHNDHRIAMAFAVAALRAEGETTILNSDAASVSYPAFFETLESIVVR